MEGLGGWGETQEGPNTAWEPWGDPERRPLGQP